MGIPIPDYTKTSAVLKLLGIRFPGTEFQAYPQGNVYRPSSFPTLPRLGSSCGRVPFVWRLFPRQPRYVITVLEIVRYMSQEAKIHGYHYLYVHKHTPRSRRTEQE